MIACLLFDLMISRDWCPNPGGLVIIYARYVWLFGAGVLLTSHFLIDFCVVLQKYGENSEEATEKRCKEGA